MVDSKHRTLKHRHQRWSKMPTFQKLGGLWKSSMSNDKNLIDIRTEVSAFAPISGFRRRRISTPASWSCRPTRWTRRAATPRSTWARPFGSTSTKASGTSSSRFKNEQSEEFFRESNSYDYWFKSLRVFFTTKLLGFICDWTLLNRN